MAATQTSQGQAAANNGHPGAHRSAGLTHRQRQAWGNAVSQIQQALETRGVDTASALRFATLLTRQPGVEILLNGKGVRYHGQIFDAAAFAHSHLADWVTGEAAKTKNQAILQGDPGYQSALAQLRLNQQTATAGLDDAQRRAVIEYGGGQFAGDPLLAQQAAANPNSILQSLLRSDAERRSQAAQQAARLGVTQGGGYQSALTEAGRVNVAGQQEGLDALTQALQQITSQKALAGAAYTTGAGQAASDATQRLLAQGLWHTVAPPSVHTGPVAFYHPPKPRKPRAPGSPPPPPPP